VLGFLQLGQLTVDSLLMELGLFFEFRLFKLWNKLRKLKISRQEVIIPHPQ
jgi:hypothetical protein